jgi:hypothetical protein
LLCQQINEIKSEYHPNKKENKDAQTSFEIHFLRVICPGNHRLCHDSELVRKPSRKEINDAQTSLEVHSLRPSCPGHCWFCYDSKLIEIEPENHPERRIRMLKQTLKYARYALAALATVGFGKTLN